MKTLITARTDLIADLFKSMNHYELESYGLCQSTLDEEGNEIIINTLKPLKKEEASKLIKKILVWFESEKFYAIGSEAYDAVSFKFPRFEKNQSILIKKIITLIDSACAFRNLYLNLK
jgi:hypothetical protein